MVAGIREVNESVSSRRSGFVIWRLLGAKERILGARVAWPSCMFLNFNIYRFHDYDKF